MSYCVTLFQHTSKLKQEYWCWLSFRTNNMKNDELLRNPFSTHLQIEARILVLAQL